MVINRVIDNAAVATASLTRAPVIAARGAGQAHPASRSGGGSTVFGARLPTSPEWAAWANGVAVRELDYHDTFLARRVLAPRRQHPADHRGRPAPRPHGGRAAARHRDRVRDPDRPGEGDQPARAQDRPRRAPRPERRRRDRHAARAADRDDLPVDRPGAAHDDRHAAVPQGRDLDLEGATRRPSPARWRSRRSTVRCAAQTSPTPIYEGEDGVIAWLLDGQDARYEVPLPEPGEARRAILDSYTKEHSAEYQAQAWIDLARKLRRRAAGAARSGERERSCCTPATTPTT